MTACKLIKTYNIYIWYFSLLLICSNAPIYAQIGKSIPNDILTLYLNEEYDQILYPAYEYLKSVDKPVDQKTAEHIRIAYFTTWAGDTNSLSFSKQLIEIWRGSYENGEFNKDIPDDQLADFYAIEAVNHSREHNTSLAIQQIKKSIQHRELTCKLDTAIQADAYQFLGRLMKIRYDNASALANYRESIRLNELINRKNATYGVVLEKIFADLSHNPKNPKILTELTEALDYYIKIGSNENIAYAYNEFGNYFLNQHEPHEAVKYFLASLNKYVEIDSENIDVPYNNLCAAYTELEKPDSILYYMRKAIQSTGENDLAQQAKLNSNLGAVFGRLNQPDSALFYFTKAMKILYPGQPVEDINYNHNPEEFYHILPIVLAYKGNALFELAKNRNNLKYLEQAIEALKVAIYQFNKIRSRSSFENKYIFARESRDFYFLALEAAASYFNEVPSINNYNQVLYFAQQSKSSVFNELQRVLMVRDSLDLNADLLNREDSLKMERSSLSQALFLAERGGGDSTVSINNINARLIQLSEEIQKISQVFESEKPVYARYLNSPDSISLSAIRNYLEPKEALIDYTYSDTTLIIIGITKEDCIVRINSTPPDFNQNISTYLRLLSTHSGTLFGKFVQMGNDFYKILIKPLQEFVQDKELIIIPDGVIGYLPFDTFSTDSIVPSRKNYNELPLLIKEYVIRYLNSMNHLETSSGGYSDAKLIVNAFAPFTQVTYDLDSTHLGALKGSKSEIEYIAKHARVKKYLSSSATKEAFQKKMSSSDILHLATHGLLSSGNPMNNRILFSQSNPNSALKLYEIINMQLSSQMVVLSACETGTGDLREGEGIMSLTRGFHNAGAPTLITSLWPAYDLPSVKIMEVFYRELQNGNSVAQAIRIAKLEYLKNSSTSNSHPAYWANYQLSGKNAIIDIMKPGPKLWMIGIGISIIIIMGLIFFYRKKFRRK